MVIEKYLRAYDLAPTLDELRQKLGLASKTSARRHVRQLADMGFISMRHARDNSRVAPRSIRLTPEGIAALSKYRILAESGILVGTRELGLTAAQFERARDAGLPVDTFRRRVWGERIILKCRDPYERAYWADRLAQALSES